MENQTLTVGVILHQHEYPELQTNLTSNRQKLGDFPNGKCAIPELHEIPKCE